MAEPIKSALLVDYDSLHRSLTAAGGEIAARLAGRAAGWVAAIESGQLIGPDGTRRQITVRRCYADPRLLGDGRDDFAAAEFEIIDCAANADGTRDADLHIAIDAIETLGLPAGYDEFILLSAEAKFTSLLTRLKARKRKTVIYADAETTPDYRTLADAFLEAAPFLEFLAMDEAAADATSAATTIDRAEIEAFARKIHAATNLPLFSPKTFAELFRYLTDEIAANGYHFQTTAKNVADRLVESGRSVTRRQVVFIVKGLALKGHVFSTSDTPRRLAEVFQEQAKYLIHNAGVTLDDQQDRLLAAWLVGRVPFTAPAAAATGAKPPDIGDAAAPATPPSKPPPTRGADQSPPRPRPEEKPAASPPASPEPGRKLAPAMITPDDAKAAIEARLPASVRMKAASRMHAPKPAADDEADAPPQPESIESSILAAIAEAVDVLVEDGSGKAKQAPGGAPPRKRPAAAQPPEAKPRPKPRSAPERQPAQEGDDIGDEIQRIIATYSRNRKDESRK